MSRDAVWDTFVFARSRLSVISTRWATADVQAYNQRRIIWKNCEPPPVEKVASMEERVSAGSYLPDSSFVADLAASARRTRLGDFIR